MLANALNFNIGTFDDPVPKTLIRINQDNYSSEYVLQESGGKYSAFFRHSPEKTKVNGLAMVRHQLLFRIEEAPSEVYPQGRLLESYQIVRTPANTPLDLSLQPTFAVLSKMVDVYATFLIGDN